MDSKSMVSCERLLQGKKVLLTGAGGGIGFETAKAFVNMGAYVIIVEIDENKGRQAENYLNTKVSDSTVFYQIDLSDEKQIYKLYDNIMKQHGCPDIIFHNATFVKIGSVEEVDVSFWDKSYAVNLKAPLLLTKIFLPHMKRVDKGTIVFVSSSGAAPYMGAYEVFKTSQVELSNTLAMELEQTGINVYTIGPGLVKTETAMNSIEIIASRMGMSTDEFYQMNENHILDTESAGLGFAMSVLNAEKYHGQEISSVQVLNNLAAYDKNNTNEKISFDTNIDIDSIIPVLKRVVDTFEQQYKGWKEMNVFERQWVLRDFKKSMGMPAELAEKELQTILEKCYTTPDSLLLKRDFFIKLIEYWKRQLKLLQGYEKNSSRLEENTKVIMSWIADIDTLLLLLS